MTDEEEIAKATEEASAKLPRVDPGKLTAAAARAGNRPPDIVVNLMVYGEKFEPGEFARCVLEAIRRYLRGGV